MKVAVLVTGLPRFIDEGAWWFNHKSNYPNPDVYTPTTLLDIDTDKMYIYSKCDLWLLSAGTADFMT